MPGEEPLDPRVQRTRQLLGDALVALLGEKAYSEISVKEIAAQATVNRATFYAHFVDKEDLFKYFLRSSFERVLADKMPEAPVEDEAYVALLLTAVFEYMDWLASQCRAAERGGHPPQPEAQLQAQLQDLLLRWARQMQAGGRRFTVSPEVLAVAVSSAVVGVARHWSRRLERPPMQEVTAQLQVMISASLQAVSAGLHPEEHT